MDTRSKILNPAAALEIRARPIAIVTGTFDVLRAEHASELREARAGAAALLAIVLPRTGELLSQRARAELVAALGSVDYVVAASPAELGSLLDAFEPAQVVHLGKADERRWLELRDRVRLRCWT